MTNCLIFWNEGHGLGFFLLGEGFEETRPFQSLLTTTSSFPVPLLSGTTVLIFKEHSQISTHKCMERKNNSKASIAILPRIYYVLTKLFPVQPYPMEFQHQEFRPLTLINCTRRVVMAVYYWPSIHILCFISAPLCFLAAISSRPPPLIWYRNPNSKQLVSHMLILTLW